MKCLFLLAASAATTLAVPPPEPKFRAATLDDKVQIGYGVAVADVDGDSKPDVLLADKKQFVWYKNPGGDIAATPWQKFILAENLTKNDNVCIAARDIDGDGKCEVAVGAEWNPGDTLTSGAVFYLIAPEVRTKPWEAVRLRDVPTVHRMKWFQPKAGQWMLAMLPLHGRGNKNGEGETPFLILYERPADVRGKWPTHQVSMQGHMTHNFDVNRSENQSEYLTVASREKICTFGTVLGDQVEWCGTKVVAGYEKDGKTLGTVDFKGAGEVRDGKLGKDKDAFFLATVEPMHGTQLVVYLPPWPEGVPYVPASRRVLSDKLFDGHALACHDFLGIGNDQIAVGWRGTPGVAQSTVGLSLWTALDEKGENWRESKIDPGDMACEDLTVADLNGDGSLDIVASGRATKNLKIYLNETSK